jgi:N6-L-threonylcarbamoyladenine synthase
MLHLGYPGGPIIDKLAKQGNPQAIRFPRAMRAKGAFDFSFSGLKTAVRSHLLHLTDPQGQPVFAADTFWPLPDAPWWKEQRNNTLASFQQAVVEVLVHKTLQAVASTRARAVAVVGGVACNSALRREMLQAGRTQGVPVYFPSPRFCTDNAAMIACAAYFRYQATPQHYQQDFLDLDAHPNLALSCSIRSV